MTTPTEFALAALRRVAERYVAFCCQAGIEADAASLDPTEQLHAQALSALARVRVLDAERRAPSPSPVEAPPMVLCGGCGEQAPLERGADGFWRLASHTGGECFSSGTMDYTGHDQPGGRMPPHDPTPVEAPPSVLGMPVRIDPNLPRNVEFILAPPVEAGPSAEDARIFWSVSSDEERFTGDFDTKEEAIAAAPGELGVLPGDTFWVGKGSLYRVTKVDVDGLFEQMTIQAGDDCGEVAEDWGPSPDEECEREIHAAVMRCLHRTKDVPTFWTVSDISRHVAPSPAPPQACPGDCNEGYGPTCDDPKCGTGKRK